MMVVAHNFVKPLGANVQFVPKIKMMKKTNRLLFYQNLLFGVFSCISISPFTGLSRITPPPTALRPSIRFPCHINIYTTTHHMYYNGNDGKRLCKSLTSSSTYTTLHTHQHWKMKDKKSSVGRLNRFLFFLFHRFLWWMYILNGI